MSTKLSKEDEKILRKLRIPSRQKVVLENYWLEQQPQEHNLGMFKKILLLLVRPVTILALAAPYFSTGMQPLVNIAIVLTWILNIYTVVLMLIILLGVGSFIANDKDEIMSRSFTKYLPGGYSFLSEMYAYFGWVGSFILTAAGGYFITATITIVCLVTAAALEKFTSMLISKFLEQKANELSELEINKISMI